MSIASLSFSATLPVYSSIGSNGTLFARNGITTQGAVTVNTQTDSVIASGLVSNGIAYTPQSVSVNGDRLTVNYGIYTGGQANDATAQQYLQAGDQASAIAGGLYGSGVTITPEGSQTNGNVTTTAYEISLNGPVNNTIGTVNRQTGYSVSSGSDGTTLSLEGISALGNALSVTYQLNGPQPSAAAEAPVTSETANTGNTGLPASLKGITTIGDLLANASGLSFSGTLTGALQAQQGTGQSTGNSSGGSVLATILNPALNLSPSTPIQISSFINTSQTAFPTQGPPPLTPPDNPYDNLTPSKNDKTSGANGTSPANQNFATGGTTQNSQPPSAYNSLANSSASTIRGVGLNVVA